LTVKHDDKGDAMIIRLGNSLAANPQTFRSQPQIWLGGLLACLTFLRDSPLPVLAGPLISNPAVALLLWLLPRLITVLQDLPGPPESSRTPGSRREDVNDARSRPCCHA
jgi:hypothetical protein